MKNNKSANSNGYLKILVWVVFVLALYAVIMTTINFLTTPKVGYIDSSVLMQKYTGAIEAREEFDKETKEWEGNIKTLETELTQLNQEFMNEGSKWSKRKVAEKKKELEKKQGDYARYARAIQEKAAKREQELIKPIFDELNVYISDFGKEYNYDIIWGTVTGGNILYGKEGRNLTDEFLEYVKEIEE